MYPFNGRPVYFNVVGCGLAMPKKEGTSFATRGIDSCVVMEVLSREFVFVAHLTKDKPSIENVCDRVLLGFSDNNSNITECTLWHTQNQASIQHANGIVEQVGELLGIRAEAKSISDNPMNSSFELTVLEQEIEHNELTSDYMIVRLSVDCTEESEMEERVSKVQACLESYGGFAVAITEGGEDSVVGNRGCFTQLFRCCRR